jgi:hypothetical protein
MPREIRGPRGRPSWVVGTKLEFLLQYSADWRKATDIGLVAAGNFYTKVTKRFIKKYGWNFDRWTDIDCPNPDPETIDDDDSQEGLTDEEVNQRHEYFRELRVVSSNLPSMAEHMTDLNCLLVYPGVVSFLPFED